LAVIAVACGSPGELDESRFPEPGQTGYADDPAKLGRAGSSGTTGVVPGGSGGTLGGGTGGSGTGGSGTGGSGTGGTGPSGSGAGGTITAGGTGPNPGGTAGQGGSPVSGDCPDDILVLLNRPGAQGGCAGNGCHVPGGQQPDLTSPGVEDRLLNVVSNCQGMPYISAGDSLIEDKIAGNPPACGSPMPLLTANALNAADEQCILDWIDEVAAGN
jgi:hypothetical protein